MTHNDQTGMIVDEPHLCVVTIDECSLTSRMTAPKARFSRRRRVRVKEYSMLGKWAIDDADPPMPLGADSFTVLCINTSRLSWSQSWLWTFTIKIVVRLQQALDVRLKSIIYIKGGIYFFALGSNFMSEMGLSKPLFSYIMIGHHSPV